MLKKVGVGAFCPIQNMPTFSPRVLTPGMTEELVNVGLGNDSCEIEMLDEEPEDMSLAYFEDAPYLRLRCEFL